MDEMRLAGETIQGGGMFKKWMLAIGATGVGAVCITVLSIRGAGAQSVEIVEGLRVRDLRIVDRDGVERIHLGPVDLSTHAGDYGVEIIAGKEGVKAARLTVGVQSGGAQIIEMIHGTGGLRLMVDAEGGVWCEVRDKGQARIDLRMKPEGRTDIAIISKDGKLVGKFSEESGK